ncbi:MAG TPA: glycoside hydrolase family 27 protein [Firmicutes bacterium]|nr:glycoside hydrolase family 27 protein [Bacillota bacterium]
MVQRTPPMGWNTWNTFGENISEKLIFETADAMAESGLRDAGYQYLVIDDCWSKKQRDSEGRLEPDPEKFPHGMKAVSDYVHSRGLKFGMYSCAGTLTCAGYPGSFEHEFIDAATFAEWGVDFLKYDYCYKPDYENGRLLYTRMGLALANSGRDILFNACSWGADQTAEWIGCTGAHSWRSTGDINDGWESIRRLSDLQLSLQPYGGINCFNDMDMLVVGMGGKGNVGFTGCTEEEYRVHFSIWALRNSPLFVGCDVRDMSDATRRTLLNREVIAINQDPACRQPFLVSRRSDSSAIWAKLLDNGDIAIGAFNMEDQEAGAWCSLSLPLASLGLNRSCGKTLVLRDLWTGEESTVRDDVELLAVPAHGCRLFRARIVDR